LPPKRTKVATDSSTAVAYRTVLTTSLVASPTAPWCNDATNGANAATTDTALCIKPSGRKSEVSTDETMEGVAHSDAIRRRKEESGLR